MVKLSERAKEKDSETFFMHTKWATGITSRALANACNYDYDVFYRVRHWSYHFFEMRCGKVVNVIRNFDYRMSMQNILTALRMGQNTSIKSRLSIKEKAVTDTIDPISKTDGHRKNNKWAVI